MSSPAPILMSRNNPEGMKLEDLLKQVRIEMDAKNTALRATEYETDDPRRQVWAQVTSYNDTIIGMLQNCETLQRKIMETLDGLGRDPGPTGLPRIG